MKTMKLLLLLFLFPFVASAQTITVNCTGDASHDTAAFTAIKTTQGATNSATIKLPHKINPSQRCKVNALTLTSNLALDNTDGSGIDQLAGLTVQGPIISSAKQLFFGVGVVSLSGNKSLGRIYPQWWGAVGDGTTDDRTAIQAAMTAAGTVSGGNVHFPATASGYLVTGSVRPASNTTISGDGYGSQILCPAVGWLAVATTNMGIINIDGKTNVTITNLRIHGTKTAPIDVPNDNGFPRSAHTPKLIYIQGGFGTGDVDGLNIHSNWLDNSAWEGIWTGGYAVNILYARVVNNHFFDINGPSALTGNWDKSLIANNQFKDCPLAIGITGSHTTITGNQIYGATSQGIGVGEIGNSGYAEVSGNTIQISPTTLATWHGIFVIGASTNGIINITGNVVQVTDSLGKAGGGGIVVSHGGVIDVNSNSVQGNGALYAYAAEIDIDTSLSFRGNTATLTAESATGNQSRGFVATCSANTLTLQSSNNKVVGMTRANSNYAYDYRSGGGSIVVTMAADVKSDGYMNIGGIIYETPAAGDVDVTDNVPLFLSSDLTKQDSFTVHAEVGMLTFGTNWFLEVASGAIDISGSAASRVKRRTRIKVGTEGTAATDDLDTINGGQDGDILIVSSFVDGQATTLKNNTGNLKIGADFTLATTADRILLMYDSGLSKWVQISRSTN